ncbi:ralA-binding protein 1 [Cylas formicarius]|uniref:ralA-binding protein 1 n=1 Tax=Cylas formicarius TaxID=197179 RepID=UPI00295847C8|nr:ralA-binding protein 1 [Cylas formicarius]
MDFDSPDVMKDFPGLYSSDLKKKGNDSDYNDETEKCNKKEMLIGKRKEKKDKKDKDKGYAALEGESSDEASAQKSKKSKAFKFTKSKDKEKRDKDESSKKNRQKKDEKASKTKKRYKPKHSLEETIDIADALPIFGVSLDLAVERGKCHDGIAIPLPIRECIDYIEAMGLTFDGVYKISGPKTKVSQIRKMYNHRQNVKLADYDIPTATSLLKMFLRDLPEPIFTNELIIRFEEAGAILNFNTREKHLKNLVDVLPPLNKLLLSWLIIHLHNVTLKEHMNKMNKQSIAAALNHTFHVSSRLLQALIHHSKALFPNTIITRYIPPLESGTLLPDKPHLIEVELAKLESLLNQIHQEMNIGFFSKTREEHLWEVQRVTTELKRKLKKFQKSKDTSSINSLSKQSEKSSQEPDTVGFEDANAEGDVNEDESKQFANDSTIERVVTEQINPSTSEQAAASEVPEDATDLIHSNNPGQKIEIEEHEDEEEYSYDSDDSSTDSEILEEYLYFDEKFVVLRFKNTMLKLLIEQLMEDINYERKDIDEYQQKINGILQETRPIKCAKKYPKNPNSFAQVRNLLVKENQMLQIKKMNLVREIMEQREMCADLTARIKWALKDTKEQKYLQCQQITA